MAYVPLTFTSEDAREVASWVNNELQKISGELKMLELVEYTAVPARRFHGMRVIADGTSWNPGSGRGVYWFDGGTSTWKLMG